MAMSFTRPDPSSPASVADAGFSTSRRGFDQAEVRDFLRMIAAELGRLQERERFLERELRTAQSNPDLSTAQLDDAALTRLLGEETARVLTTARESAAEIRQKAEQAAAQLLSEASDEAGRMREEAEIEASRRRTDAAADAEAELSMAKQQGREMVNEARVSRACAQRTRSAARVGARTDRTALARTGPFDAVVRAGSSRGGRRGVGAAASRGTRRVREPGAHDGTGAGDGAERSSSGRDDAVRDAGRRDVGDRDDT